MQEIKRSGYDGLLPAGMVLTGGTSALPGIRQLASQVLGMPVRTAQPENLIGLVDQLKSPAFSTSVGLLQWAAAMSQDDLPSGRGRARRGAKGEIVMNLEPVKNLLRRLLP
jgi:cell division protein FtsA